MDELEQSAQDFYPAHREDHGYMLYGDAPDYLATRQLDAERLGWVEYSETRERWAHVLNFIGAHEPERLPVAKRLEAAEGELPCFVPWQRNDSGPWWVSKASLDDILAKPPDASICEATRIIEEGKRLRQQRKAERRQRGMFTLWEAANEAASALGLPVERVLDTLLSSASTGVLDVYEHGQGLPTRMIAGARVHAMLEATAEELDAWFAASKGRGGFSFSARARELASGGTPESPVSVAADEIPEMSGRALWTQADPDGKRELAADALKKHGSKIRAAEALGISRARLQTVLRTREGATVEPDRGATVAPPSLEHVWKSRRS